MFDLGFAEMVVIAIVALVVIGPERLPTVARKAGMYFARMRRFVTNVKADVEREFRTEELEKMLSQQNEEIKELRDMMKSTQQSTLDTLNETEYLVRASTSTEPDPTKKDKKQE